jgi:hypothetical protein
MAAAALRKRGVGGSAVAAMAVGGGGYYLFKELSAKSRPPTTFVFSYVVTKNCNITVLWLLDSYFPVNFGSHLPFLN